jgi:type I restriction enzyme M protein
MNLLLHGVSGNTDDELPVACRDSLREPPETKVDVVLTNLPFGIKGSITYSQDKRLLRIDDTLTVVRPDFWVQTANKQLNFLQHIVSLLKPGGRAAVIVPDNVLFETGAASVIRRRLLESCRVHTLLRLPPGLFYAQGVKSNVLFFDRPSTATAEPGSGIIWAYELRSDKRYSLKTKPLQREDLEEFVALFRSGFRCSPSSTALRGERFHRFEARHVLETDNCGLDLTWDDGSAPTRVSSLARLEEISRLVADDLRRALALIGNPHIS